MHISAISNNINQIGKSNLANKTTQRVLNAVSQPDCIVSHAKHKKAKNVLRAMLLGATTMLAASCATLKGGSFIYNQNSNKIEFCSPDIGIDDLNNIETQTNKYNLHGFHDKEYIKSVGVDKWIEANKDKLAGSCLFDRNESTLSHLISGFTKGKNCDNKYVPSHSTPIYREEDGSIKIMQVNPPKVYVEDLADYLKNSKNDYMIFIRDFDIDDDSFSKSVKQYEGTKYGYMSAFQTISSVLNMDGGIHCSEVYTKELQKQGMFKNIDANCITPHTLLHLLANNHNNEEIMHNDHDDVM